ncbi:alpha/beta fold hydrolase [Geomesophilobacter sediminis]|uniref:Alpha/beta hydrolase n=1 Tax=Geomesophilobacter sediminis TaxID=2798584 RepID=A0A8J7M1W0_9BACT|nr:alpha/beta hydrolase [Geomesophilobacter sediminis]MBJ6727159.1 alpha/beta hydrolase [Geomesophilobacter sediminis]
MMKERILPVRIGLLAMLMLLGGSVGLVPHAMAKDLAPLSITLEGYAYPYPVSYLPLTIEHQDLRMAYMDVAPNGAPNGRTVLLLHGKNFFGAYWKDTIHALSAQGYRVVVPDQIGFGKSSKPDLHYSFHLLAANTKKILDSLGIKKVVVVGHSMGGMVATRFTLMYPETVSKLVLEDPIGLEDYRTLVPYAPLEELYLQEMKATSESIFAYHKGYFVKWKPEYGASAEAAARQKLSGEYPRLALSSAETYQMIYEQPVCYEFGRIRVPTLLVIGQSDRTVVGKARVPKELLPKAGQYPELGRKTVAQIPGARLIEIPSVGHIPHLEAPERFHAELLSFLHE